MLENVKTFIEYVRGLDERAKTKWIWTLSGASMLAVILFWVVLLNFSVETVTAPNPKTSLAELTGQPAPPGFFQGLGVKLKEDASVIYNGIGKFFSKGIEAKHEIIIENK